MYQIIKPLLFFIIIMLAACSENRESTPIKANQDSVAQNAVNFPRDEIKRDLTRTEQHPLNREWYVYEYAIKDTLKGKTKPILESVDIPQDDGHGEIPEVPYSITDANRPPIFKIDCLDKENPVDCSNKAIKAFLRDHIEYPEKALAEGHDGFEYITFVISEEGEVMENIIAESNEKSCKGCAMAAIRAIAQMEDKWAPAIRNGQAIAVKVTLPVRFKSE